MAKKPTALPEVDFDVVDVRNVAITADPQGATTIGLQIAGGQTVNLIFSPEMFAKLEALLAKANEAQAGISTIQ